MSLISFLLIGLIVGWLAGVLIQGRGFGIAVDILVGIVGAVIGGFLSDLLGFTPNSAVGGLVMAVIGACVFVAIVKALRRV